MNGYVRAKRSTKRTWSSILLCFSATWDRRSPQRLPAVRGPVRYGPPQAQQPPGSGILDLGKSYGLGSANNGGGTDGEEFTFPGGAAAAGQFIYVARQETRFLNWFGFAPTHVSSVASINGDDAVELFSNGEVIDVFGQIDVDGSGQPWEYSDGWAYRVNGTGGDSSSFFVVRRYRSFSQRREFKTMDD